MKKNIKSLVGLVKCFLILISGILLISLVSATDIQVWQGKYLTGEPVTTYTFNFTVYDDVLVGTPCWSSKVDLTTDADRWWYTERIGVLESCSDPLENYYLNININGADQVPRRLLKHLKYVDMSSDVNFTNSVSLAGNLTLGGKIKFAFGEFIDNLVDGWLRISGNLNVTENITADYFIGNGSQLTSVCLEDGSNCPAGITDTQKNTSGIYLYNDSDTIYFNESQLNLTIDDRASGLGDNATWNQSFADTLYILQTAEGDLNVNSSNYWDDYNVPTDLNYRLLLYWANITDRPTHLSNFTDNILWTSGFNTTFDARDSDTTYSHLSNFTDNILWTAGFNATGDTRWLISYTESDPLWSGNQSLVYLKSNPSKYWNATFALFNKSYADTLYLTSYTETDPLWSGNQSLVYLKSNPSGFWNSTFALFNKTYADTLYADISVTGDDATWNKTYADTLYADISVTGDNSTWNQSLASSLYSLISEPLWSGNQSLVYLKSNPSKYWNETFALFNKTYADTLYLTSYTETDPKWTANETNVAFKNEANVFTAGQSLTGQNITAINCIIFDSGGKICSGV